MEQGNVILPMITKIYDEIDNLEHETSHIMVEVTRNGKVLLQSLAITTAFLEYVEKRNHDRDFKRLEKVKLRDEAARDYFLKL